MTISEEQLIAYVDGELDARGRAEVEAAMVLDPNIARRVEQQQALRRRLQTAFDDVLKEPVPDRLVSAARTAATGATVANLATKRGERAAKADRAGRRFGAPLWLAIAASLLIGLFMGFVLRSPVSPFSLSGGQLVARGSVAEALNDQVASNQPTDAPVRVGLSFQDDSGNFCRTFVIPDSTGVAGLACHEGESWAVQVLARHTPETANGGYRPAAGDLPPAVLNVVEDRIVGEPLDAQAEMTARRNGWRNKK